MPLIFSEIHFISERDLMTMLEVGMEEAVVGENGETRAILLPIGKSVIFLIMMLRLILISFLDFILQFW